MVRNRLAGETSPYLRQHADNPVDWYPWGPEAFARSRDEDLPIFLSVGYSACHWCHVMAHESFENPDTAAILNRSFVCIKVDREERPDVDAVYMEAVQAITGSGGWPMSVFLTSDRRPFFGGTYFPPADRHGTPSFRTVLGALAEVWSDRRAEVEEQADEIAQAIDRRVVIAPSTDSASLFGCGGTDPVGPVPDLLAGAVEELHSRFDAEWGGFGGAPKFPEPGLVDLLLRRSAVLAGGRPPRDSEPAGPGDVADEARQMAVRTLDAMAAGGIHDHLGGGFARYSTDREWLVPHFEKMLYDQAGLLRAFVHGWQVTGDDNYRAVASGIVRYVARDLTTAEGGVCSAEDADSEGVEGRFYVWTPEQIRDALATGPVRGADSAIGSVDDVAHALTQWFEVVPAGNFEGSSILRRPVGAPLVGPEPVELGRRLLFDARSTRVRPALDDKVLTEWNAMYGSALAEAAAATGEDGWSDQAVAIGAFLWDHLRRPDGRWLRSWQRQGGARHLAYAADHANVVDCFTRLGELTGEAVWTERAVTTADQLLDLFGDRDGAGFFTTGHDAEPLIVRTKDVFDGATPSANAVAALALARLGALTADARFTQAARDVVDLIGELLVRHPTAFAHTVLTAEMLLDGFTEVVVTGDRGALVEAVQRRWLPGVVLSWGEPIPSPLWHQREAGLAYVCRNYTCQLPTDDVTTLLGQVAAHARARHAPPAGGARTVTTTS